MRLTERNTQCRFTAPKSLSLGCFPVARAFRSGWSTAGTFIVRTPAAVLADVLRRFVPPASRSRTIRSAISLVRIPSTSAVAAAIAHTSPDRPSTRAHSRRRFDSSSVSCGFPFFLRPRTSMSLRASGCCSQPRAVIHRKNVLACASVTETDPIIVTEFGDTVSACATDYSAALIQYADAHVSSWTAYWLVSSRMRLPGDHRRLVGDPLGRGQDR